MRTPRDIVEDIQRAAKAVYESGGAVTHAYVYEADGSVTEYARGQIITFGRKPNPITITLTGELAKLPRASE